MVKIERKQLIIIMSLVLVIVLICVGGFLGFKYLSRDDKSNDPPPQTREEIAVEESKTERLDNLAYVTNGNDVTAKLSTSMAFARDSSNSVKPRLDAYRICIQSAIELNDEANQSICFSEGIALTESLTIEEEKRAWQKDLTDINNGTPITEEETDGEGR